MTNNKLTDELLGVYAAYSAWIRGGAPVGGIFKRNTGLCANAYDYFSAIGVDSGPHLEAMHAAFVAARLNEKLPFNHSPEQYEQEQRSAKCHLNPVRLAWVVAELQERRRAENAEPVAYVPRGHIERYLRGANSGCWVYGERVNSDDEAIYRTPPNVVIDRQTVINRVQNLCTRLPGATYANAAEFALDEIEGLSIGAEPVAWQFKSVNGNWINCDRKIAVEEGCEVRPLYTAPPAPVVPEGKTFEQIAEITAARGAEYSIRDCIVAAEWWNACRAAMLQGADGTLTNEGTIPGGNSPVIPDGWVMVPVDMPHEMMRAVQVNSELGAYAATNLNGAYSLFREFWDGAVTAAPLQEMKP